jgi:hypothetical protein
MLRFFTRIGGNELILPTPEPVNLVGITPGISQPTQTPAAVRYPDFYETCGEVCTLDQIRGMVKFPVKALADLPPEMAFIGATGDTNEVVLVYRRENPLSVINIVQGLVNTETEINWPVAGNASVEPVQIGNVTGEYLKGGWTNYGGAKTATWDPGTNHQTLRWEEQDIFFILSVEETGDSMAMHLDKTGIVSLASNLTDHINTPISRPTAENSINLGEVEKLAGFQAIEPDWLPDGYQFAGARYIPDQNIICLEYTHPDGVWLGNPGNPPAPSLSIAESVSSPMPDLKNLIAAGLRPDQVLLEKESLAVGGTQDGKGTYAYGSLDPSPVCGNILEHQALQFQVKEYNISLFTRGGDSLNPAKNWLTRQEMVKLAESITGVHLISENQPDPEYLTSVSEAEKLAGFSIKLPTKLPEGKNLDHIRFEVEESQRKVKLYYSDANLALEIIEVAGSENTLQTISKDHPEAFDPVTVHNQPALISQGYWDNNGWKEFEDGGDGSASVTWFEDGIQYSVSGFNEYPRAVWLAIAESLQ